MGYIIDIEGGVYIYQKKKFVFSLALFLSTDGGITGEIYQIINITVVI